MIIRFYIFQSLLFHFKFNIMKKNQWTLLFPVFITVITSAQTFNLVGDPEMNASINTIAVDSNNKIYVAGEFSYGLVNNGKSYVARWNFSDWEDVGSFAGNNSIRKIITDNANNVYVIGDFTNFNNKYYVAKYNGTSWTTLGNFTNSSKITDVVTDGTNIYIIGVFTNIQNGQTYYINKWNGIQWSAEDNGEFNGVVNTIAFDKDHNLNVAGEFKNSLGYYCVFKKSNNEWSEVGKLRSAYPVRKILCDNFGRVYAAHSYSNSGNPSPVLSKYNPDTNTWVELDRQYPHLFYMDKAGTIFTKNGCGTSCQNEFKVYYSNSNSGEIMYVGGWNGAIRDLAVDNYGYMLVASYETSWQSKRYGIVKSTSKILGIEDFKNDSGSRIFPNPSSGIFNVSKNEIISSIEVYDMAGKMIVTKFPNSKRAQINLEKESRGTYLLKIKCSKMIFSEKVIVK